MQLTVSRWDLEAFLKDAREAFPHAGLTAGDVRLVHRGLLPMVVRRRHRTSGCCRKARSSITSKHGLPGLVSMFGVRYTTARHTAAAGGGRGVPGAGPRDAAALPDRGDAAPGRQHHAHGQLPEGGRCCATSTASRADTLRRIAATYGTGYDRVLQMARDVPALGAPLGRDCDVIGAEILYAARQEMAAETGRCADAPHRSRRGRPPGRRRGRARPPRIMAARARVG